MPIQKLAFLLIFILSCAACGGGDLEVTDPQAASDPNTQIPPPAGGPADQPAPRPQSSADEPAQPDDGPDDAELEAMFNVYSVDYFKMLPEGEQQRERLCDHGFEDRFARWYCSPGQPTAGTLDDLLIAMDLKEVGDVTPRHFAVTGHSSSLVMRRTSSINPRVVYFNDVEVEPDSDYIAMGYVRGDFFVEVAAFDPGRDQLNFYLVKTEKGCEPDCTNADRFLPQAEIGWEGLTVYAAEDLQNTAADCLACHQPGGAGSERILRMQELVQPWTHWFQDDAGSQVLLDQFLLAHDSNERYGTIPASRMDDSAPEELEAFIRSAGFGDQPNMYRGNLVNFDSPTLDRRTTAWNLLYEEALAGRAISPPYFGIDPFDREKLSGAIEKYRDVVSQREPVSEMPDMNDVFRDDRMDELGFEAGEGLDAKGIVQHRCGFCHDGRFPGISRDNFRVQDFPDGLSRDMKDKVIQRINLPKSSPLRMPPTLFTDLPPEQIEAITDAVQ